MDTQTAMIREIILQRISHILQNVYKDPPHDLSDEELSGKLAFKADPELNELRLALERMKREEYGRCIFCKGTIDSSQLMANPTAHFCAQCTGILRYRTTPLHRAESIREKNSSDSRDSSTSMRI